MIKTNPEIYKNGQYTVPGPADGNNKDGMSRVGLCRSTNLVQ